nr:ELM2 domain-containing protein [Tanacetum cinerariifolium]
KKKLKGKSKKDVSDSELETDRKRSGSDSSEIDTKSIKRLISKLKKKVKKKESDEDSVPKKVKKKLTKKVEKEVSDEESFLKKGNKKFTKKVKKEESNEDSIPKKGDRIEAGQFYPLELKKVCVNDIAQKFIVAQEIDFLFKVNFLTLFTNMMGKADGLKGQICLDVVRHLREDSMIFDIDWCGVILEDYMRKASLKCPGDGKFVALHEKYVNLFKDPISFEDDGNGDNVGDDDEENGDDDGGNVDNDAYECDGNGDEESKWEQFEFWERTTIGSPGPPNIPLGSISPRKWVKRWDLKQALRGRITQMVKFLKLSFVRVHILSFMLGI